MKKNMFVCIKAKVKNLIIASMKTDKCLVKSSFTNWRKALEKVKGFDKHKCPDAQREAKDWHFNISNSTICQVDDLLSESYHVILILIIFLNRIVHLNTVKHIVRAWTILPEDISC